MIQNKTLTEQQKNTKWHNMVARCYRECYHKSHPGTIYSQCTVCEEWLGDKQSFFDWLDTEYYTVPGEQMDLDKDILVKGNRIYSPDTCLIVPHYINVMWSQLSISCPAFDEQEQVWYVGEDFYLSPEKNSQKFEKLEDARAYCANVKYLHIKEVAELYKDKIPEKVYNAMLAWKVDEKDWDAWAAA